MKWLFRDFAARPAVCHRLTDGWHHIAGGCHHIIIVDGSERSLVSRWTMEGTDSQMDVTEFAVIMKSTAGEIAVSATWPRTYKQIEGER